MPHGTKPGLERRSDFLNTNNYNNILPVNQCLSVLGAMLKLYLIFIKTLQER